MGETEMTAETGAVQPLFHGGCPGLRTGDLILPADDVGTASVSGDRGAPYRTDRVYVTTDLSLARSYAGIYASPKAIRDQLAGRLPSLRELSYGDVYEVEPLGPLEPDLDYETPDLSFQTTQARVLRVIEMAVPPIDLDPQLAGLIAAERAQAPTHSPRPPSRNELCSCGSGRKYKKCCGR